jgi:hypothetical protein
MTTLTFKVSDDEAEAIRRRARQEQLTVSEFIRRRASSPVAPPTKPRLEKCSVTGAMIFAPAAPLPPLSVESTREMLSDFP